MSRLSVIYAAVLITLLASTVTAATTKATKPIPERRFYVDNVNQFALSVGQALRSIASSMRRLIDFHRPIKSRYENDLTPLLNRLRSLEPVCRYGWTMYETSCFLFIRCHGTCSPNDARKSCMRKQSRLAKVSSSSHEQLFIRMLNTSGHIILGGSDRDTEGTWRWPDGSLFDDGYTNWRSGEPGGGSNANCMILSVYTKEWHDTTCSFKYQASYKPAYVCETSPTFL